MIVEGWRRDSRGVSDVIVEGVVTGVSDVTVEGVVTGVSRGGSNRG